MGRQAKHNWRMLFLDYSQGDYKSVAEYAKAMGIDSDRMRKEFRKLGHGDQGIKQGEKNKAKKQGEDKTRQKKQGKINSFQCAASAHKSGERCKSKALPGSEYCRRHADQIENQCTSNSRQTKQRCKNKALEGKTKCKFHGGNSSGPPKGSQNNLRHGLYARFLPDDLKQVYDELSEAELTDLFREVLVGHILAMSRAQSIMHVSGPDDDTEEITMESDSMQGSSTGKRTHFARDKYAGFLLALSKAGNSLATMLKTLKKLQAGEDDDDGSLSDLARMFEESRRGVATANEQE